MHLKQRVRVETAKTFTFILLWQLGGGVHSISNPVFVKAHVSYEKHSLAAGEIDITKP
jgi:hypothetical protein